MTISAETVSLSADLLEIERMNARLEAWLGAFRAPAELAARVKLCLNEAVENAIRYGFNDVEPDAVTVRLSGTAECVDLELADCGRAFNPLEVAAAEKMTDLETASIGGFGILLMRDAASEISYARRDGRNILTARFCPR